MAAVQPHDGVPYRPRRSAIQEMIPGGGDSQFSFCAVADRGRIFWSLVARRRRQYLIEFGNASTFVETASQPVVEANGRRFMEAIGFDGMGEIEFKFDRRTASSRSSTSIHARGWPRQWAAA